MATEKMKKFDSIIVDELWWLGSGNLSSENQKKALGEEFVCHFLSLIHSKSENLYFMAEKKKKILHKIFIEGSYLNNYQNNDNDLANNITINFFADCFLELINDKIEI